MGELTLTVFRLGLLALLWLFVFSIVGVLRSDLYGTRVSNRSRRAAQRAAARTAAQRSSQRPSAGRPAPTPTALAVTEGRLAGTIIPLRPSGVLIGRNPECALVLDDDFASGRHARLFPRADGWFVEDLGSTNGTFLGGTRLSGPPQPVTVGSTLRIGRTVLELQG
ncbi:MAG: FHA domain-containing protein FhaB/FipA [Dermatophilaceae bacterium]